MNRNRGFSLIELVVALAIFAIAGITVFGFMSYSSGNYSRTNEDVKLQYEQQLAVNHIRDAILEATNGIYYDNAGEYLVIYSQGADSSGNIIYPVTKISFDAVKSQMYMAQKVFTSASAISLPSAADDRLLAENVTAFSVDLSKVKKDKVQFAMTFTSNDRTQSVNPVVALRNHLLVSKETDTIYEKVPIEVNSFIKSIVIQKDGETFAQNATDTIKKYGESVSVQYQAVVTGTQDSTREYAVTWSVSSTNSGISVNNGLVTVNQSVLAGTTFTLIAASVDDPLKYASLTIVVEDNGVYPVSASLKNDDRPYEGNGYRKYTLIPTLTYTDGSQSNDASLFIWKGVSSLPEGCSFNEKTGVLYLTEKANGYEFEIYVISRRNDAKGNTIISNTIKIVVGTIPPYQSGPTLKLGVAPNFQRGGTITPLVSWTNTTSSDYTYHWTISEYKDAESSEWGTDQQSFTQCIELKPVSSSSLTQTTCTTSSAYRYINIECKPRLNWKKTFKMKISVYAEDSKGNKYYAEDKYTTIEPVTVTLTPTDYVLQEGEMSIEKVLYKLPQGSVNRRCFMVTYTGIYVNGANALGKYSARGNNCYLYYDITEGLVSGVSNPGSISLEDREVVGFQANPLDWENYSQKPVTMKFLYFVQDSYGNEATSNVLTYKIDYNN